MSNIRKAYTVEIIDRRLRDAEAASAVDAMELVGIHDELSRVERKWLEKQTGQHQPKNVSRSRPLSDAGQMNVRFERLTRLIDAALRRSLTDDISRPLLQRTVEVLRNRKPLEAAAE